MDFGDVETALGETTAAGDGIGPNVEPENDETTDLLTAKTMVLGETPDDPGEHEKSKDLTEPDAAVIDPQHPDKAGFVCTP